MLIHNNNRYHFSETHQRITAHCPEDEPTYRVKFDNPVEINADVLYSACVILNGAQSYYGKDISAVISLSTYRVASIFQ